MPRSPTSISAPKIETFTRRVHEETRRLVPGLRLLPESCGHNDDYDMRKLWSAQEDIRSLKSLILFGVRGMAAYAHAYVLGYEDEALSRFLPRRCLPSAKTGAWRRFAARAGGR